MLGDKPENDPQFCTSLCSRILIHSFSQLHEEHLAIEIQTGKADFHSALPSNQYQRADFIIFSLALVSITPEKLLPCDFPPHHKNSSVLQQKWSASRCLFSRYDCTSGAYTLVQQKVWDQTDQYSIDLLTLVLLQIHITEENNYSQLKLPDNTLLCQPSEHKTKWKSF